MIVALASVEPLLAQKLKAGKVDSDRARLPPPASS
jgi:hypothetical protein